MSSNHGLHLLRSGELDQVRGENVTAVMNHALLLPHIPFPTHAG
ncbi:hypothetical protein ACIQFP_16580 [Nocardiopsis alba]